MKIGILGAGNIGGNLGRRFAEPALTHSGSNTMWLVTTWLAPERGAVLVVATNAASDDAAVVVDEAFGPMIDRFLP